MSESTDINWPSDLPIPVNNPRHRFSSRNIKTEMESSRYRVRKTSPNPKELIEVTWRFNEDQFEEFETFFKDDLSNGAFAFVIPLTDLVSRKVAFIDSTFRVNRTDNLHTVTATLEIVET